jgi:MFS family permease
MMPSRQSMVPEIVGMDRMMNAVALNMGGMNFMRLFAPAGGGVLLATVGADLVYFLMTGFYLFSVVTLSKVPTVVAAAGRAGAAVAPSSAARGEGGRRAGRARGGGGLRDIIEGFQYVARNRIILMLLSSNLLIVLVSMPYQMMLPGYVLDVLKEGPRTLGLLQSVSAVGALGGTFVIASLPNRRRGKLLLFGSLLMGVALVAFSFSTVVLFTAGTMIVIGVGQTFRMSLSNVLVQTYVDDAFRGRVMSLNMMQMNVASFGVFGAGMLAAVIGPQLTIGGMAVALIVLVVLLYAFVPRLRNLD